MPKIYLTNLWKYVIILITTKIVGLVEYTPYINKTIFRGKIAMRLSTRGRYGTKLMLELALHYGEGPIPLKDIAENQEISSEKYLAHLIPPLKAFGLISSSQGAHGGYFLVKPPQDITLKEVVQAVEGNMALVECVTKPTVCDRASSCITREIWKEMRDKMMKVLESTSLQDMVNQQKLPSLTYNI